MNDKNIKPDIFEREGNKIRLEVKLQVEVISDIFSQTLVSIFNYKRQVI